MSKITGLIMCLAIILGTHLTAKSSELSVTLNVNNINCGILGSASIVINSSCSGNPLIEWSTSETGAEITNLSSGSYSVTVTDDIVCGDTIIDFDIITESELDFSINYTPTICAGSTGSAQFNLITGTGSFMYEWSTGAISPGIQIPTAGDYCLTVTDLGSSCQLSKCVTIEFSGPTVAITTEHITCHDFNDGRVTAVASGGTAPYSYQWNGFSGPVAANLLSGNYYVTVTDDNGCTGYASTFVENPPIFMYSLDQPDGICFGEQAELHVTAIGGVEPYLYSWNDVSTMNSADRMVSPPNTTQYTVSVYDANMCQFPAQSATVVVSQPIQLEVDIIHERCFNSCDGSATLDIIGGIPPFTFSWDSNTDYITDLCAGIYTVTVTDLFECTASELFEISQPSEIVYTASTVPATCYGFNDGQVTMSVVGGVPPYVYLWSNGHDWNTLVASAGTYTVTVTDDNNCRIYAQYTITEPDEILLTPVDDRTICENQNIILSSQVSGGNSPYDFSWTGTDGSLWNSNMYSVSPSTTTVYTLVVTDSHGCQSEPEVCTITVIPSLQSEETINICSGDSIYWHNNWYSDAGDYEINYVSFSGCDSIYKMHLNILPIPQLIAVNHLPVSGVLSQGSFGQISIENSEYGTEYFILCGNEIVVDVIEGNGGAISFGSTFEAGTYFVMSRKIESACEIVQDVVVFVAQVEGNAINACVSYGNESAGFGAGDVLVSLFKSLDNSTAVLIDEKLLGQNGQAIFENIEVGTYFLSSVFADVNIPEIAEHVFYPSSFMFENATEIIVGAQTNYVALINHPVLYSQTGSNSCSGTVNNDNNSKSGTSVDGLAVILMSEETQEILDLDVTDVNGEYNFENIPDFEIVKIFVNNLEHQQWIAWVDTTSTNQEYTVDFIVDGNTVAPIGLQSISEVKSGFEFEIYPNPANNIIFIKHEKDIVSYSIYDIKGRLVKKNKFENNKVAISELVNGSYLLILQSEDGDFGIRKFIKR
jgi:hypothetical protein